MTYKLVKRVSEMHDGSATEREHVARLQARPRLAPPWRHVECRCAGPKPDICPVHGFAPALGGDMGLAAFDRAAMRAP